MSTIDSPITSQSLPAGDGEPDIVIGTREQLFHLLAEAAEIEHALMCSYLYAAFSLKAPGAPGVSSEDEQVIGRWRKLIMSVAIEEMGHLVLVSNLSAAIGSRPHFDRPNFPVTSGYFPAEIQLKLTPFSLETLDHFIYLERPLGADLADGVGFDGTHGPRAQAVLGLMPSAQDYTTVSHLYEAIRENLIALTKRIGETDVFIGSPLSQIGRDVMDMTGVDRITSLPEAIAALDLIIEQGEGATSSSEDCHFTRFKQIRDEYETRLRTNPDFSPAHPVISNPVMRRPTTEEDLTWVSAPDAARILDFCNALYNLLLRALVQAYSRDRKVGEQKQFIDLAIALMHAMALAVQQLVTLPATPDGPMTAGMSFTTLRALQPFAWGDIECLLLRERVEQLQATARALQPTCSGFESVVSVLDSALRRFVDADNASVKKVL